MIIKRACFAFVGMFLLVACSHTPSSSVYNIPAGSKFAVREVTVNLFQKMNAEGFPSESELAEMFSRKISQDLEERGMLAFGRQAESVELSIAIDYQRHFAGEDTPFPSNSVVRPIVGYTITAFRDGSVLDVIKRSGLTTSHGFLGNLKTVATMGLGNDAASEEVDVRIIASGMVDFLVRISG